MKILIIDWRGRGADMQDVLTLRGHKVTHSRHVNGTDRADELTSWSLDAKNTCEKYLFSLAPDLILLHVGKDQLQWDRCLPECYASHVVVCFTGLSGGVPPEAREDCINNSKHCYCPLAFKAKYTDPAAWERSAEGRVTLRFIDGMGKELQKAKLALQQFDQNLEDALTALSEALKKLLSSGKPSEDALAALIAKRDELLGRGGR